MYRYYDMHQGARSIEVCKNLYSEIRWANRDYSNSDS